MILSGNKGLGNHVVSQGHSLADVQACFPSCLGHNCTRRQCRESQKEKELLEKKLERTEKARAQEVSYCA